MLWELQRDLRILQQAARGPNRPRDVQLRSRLVEALQARTAQERDRFRRGRRPQPRDRAGALDPRADREGADHLRAGQALHRPGLRPQDPERGGGSGEAAEHGRGDASRPEGPPPSVGQRVKPFANDRYREESDGKSDRSAPALRRAVADVHGEGGERAIGWWHTLDSGFAGRKALAPEAER